MKHNILYMYDYKIQLGHTEMKGECYYDKFEKYK